MARYDNGLGKPRPTWGDAIALPMLYHALQAQPRHYTFILAALDGYDGEKTFLAWLRASAPRPAASVVLDSLGMGAVDVHIEPVNPAGRDKATALANAAMWQQVVITRQLMGIPAPPFVSTDLTTDGFIFLGQWTSDVFGSSLFTSVKKTPPAALVYSEPEKPLNAPAFHQDFDFLAWFLCRIDQKLQPAPGPPTGVVPQPPAVTPAPAH